MSNVIKSSYYIPLNDRKLIEVLQSRMEENGQSLPGIKLPDSDAEAAEKLEAERQAILEDARRTAEQMLKEAEDDAGQIVEAAKHDAETWWNEQRARDEQTYEENRTAGYEAGMQEGAAAAEQAVRTEYEQVLLQAQQLLLEAHEAKRQIVQEAEPFLVELSCGIAEKVLGRELRQDPEWTNRMIRKILARRKWKAAVTICVAPDKFQQLFNSRDELFLAAGGSVEVQVVPDPAVRDDGCMIRTEYGTMDARVDTQLEEIKTHLMKMAEENGSESDHG